MVHDSRPTATVTPLRAQARAVKEQLYLQGARRLVSEGGLDALTMQRLADELGCAIGAVYRYFPSKDALIADLQHDAIEVLLASYAEARVRLGEATATGEEAGVITSLLAFPRFFAAAQAAHPEELNLIMLGLAAPHTVIGDENLERIAPGALRFFDMVRTMLAEAADAGVLDPGDVGERAALWSTALLGTLMGAKLSRYDATLFDPGRTALGLTEHLLAGWGADREALAAGVRHLAALEEEGVFALPGGNAVADGRYA